MTAHRRAHRDVLFGSKLSTVHESEMARIYGFTERMRAILPRHVHTPPQIVLFILRDFRADPKRSIASSSRRLSSRDDFPQGISSRPSFKATLSRGIFTVIYNIILPYIEGA